jgi:predicted ATP-dependent Lon-type protease
LTSPTSGPTICPAHDGASTSTRIGIFPIPKVSRDIFTDHFGLVSDVLAEAFTRLRDGSRAATLMGRVHFGRALSGRDQNAVTKTVSALLTLIHPDGTAALSQTTNLSGLCGWHWKCDGG